MAKVLVPKVYSRKDLIIKGSSKKNVKETNLPNLIKLPADSHEGLSGILIQKRLQRQIIFPA